MEMEDKEIYKVLFAIIIFSIVIGDKLASLQLNDGNPTSAKIVILAATVAVIIVSRRLVKNV